MGPCTSPLSLVQSVLERADRLIVSLFVNPKQFNRQADLRTHVWSVPVTGVSEGLAERPAGSFRRHGNDVTKLFPQIRRRPRLFLNAQTVSMWRAFQRRHWNLNGQISPYLGHCQRGTEGQAKQLRQIPEPMADIASWAKRLLGSDHAHGYVMRP